MVDGAMGEGVKRMRLFLVLLLCLLPVVTQAKEAAPIAEDPVLEKKVNEITSELRCLVCQNQTIADSHAELAVDLKNQVRDMVKEGKTRDDVVEYMVKRYGDFVRYRPPVKPTTYLLWTGPFLLLGLGIAVLVYNLNKRRRMLSDDDQSLSPEESERLAALLKSDEGESKL
jgi:cytochrome c-type biogenesis protein CcmH